MYAIVDIQGQQFKLEKDAKVYVHRLEGEEGAKVDFDKVLLVDDNGAITIGAPTVDGMTVSATILSHLKDKKVQVFKKKRRKGYQKQNGHRQYLTQVQVTAIGGAAAKKSAKKETAPKAETEAPAEGQ
jgi:large subunit ribosomal protein L21